MARQAVVRGIRTECATSSSVAEKESMSWWGSWDRKPMVSTYSTVMRLGSGPAWTVTSRVANSWSLGCSAASPVSALIRVVFPGGDKGGGDGRCGSVGEHRAAEIQLCGVRWRRASPQLV